MSTERTSSEQTSSEQTSDEHTSSGHTSAGHTGTAHEDRPDVPTTAHEDIVSAPGSERETEVLQDDQDGSPALDDPDIDRSAIKVLPGTGDYTDDGDVDVDPADLHIPTHPDRDSVAPVAQGSASGTNGA